MAFGLGEWEALDGGFQEHCIGIGVLEILVAYIYPHSLSLFYQKYHIRITNFFGIS